jgi:hypothetical protein
VCVLRTSVAPTLTCASDPGVEASQAVKDGVNDANFPIAEQNSGRDAAAGINHKLTA